MEVCRGRIMAFHGSWMSGLGCLEIDDADRGLVQVPCENASTVRALDACFGDVIGENHCVNPAGSHVGREVYYSMDDMGLVLEAFTPVEEACDELVEAYKSERVQ